jgi:hypothetical protein
MFHKFIKLQWNFHVKFLCETVDLITKLRIILNGDSLDYWLTVTEIEWYMREDIIWGSIKNNSVEAIKVF